MTIARHAAALSVLLIVGALALPAGAQPLPKPPSPLQPRGLVTSQAGVAPGYVLFNPSLSKTIFLIDNDGRVVHTWEPPTGGTSNYLRPDGSIVRGARDPSYLRFKIGGTTGLLQQVDWQGNVTWQWRLADDRRVLHHDIEPLPNGNLLALAWELKTPEEAIAAGRRPDSVTGEGLLFDWVLEIEPVKPDGARIVWEWHVFDHLVQDLDPKAANHGDPAQSPGRLDVNAGLSRAVSDEELAQLQALGYVDKAATPKELRADFLHVNAIDHHPGLDQIALSVPALGEVWILDHSTTTAQAAGRSGGRAGRGGDILYRWGNPSAYGRGEGSPQRLFFQHDVRWIDDGEPGAFNLTIFNNGRDRPGRPFSSVDEIRPPLLPNGTYSLEDGRPFGPSEPVWTWELRSDHFAPFISGAHRIANGNTLACVGTDGTFVEVDRAGRIVWEFRNPWSGNVRLADGSLPGPGLDGLPYAVFRATRIPPDHPALVGRNLAPLSPQPEWTQVEPPAAPEP